MNSAFLAKAALVLAALAVSLPATAVTITATAPTWTNPVGGSGVVLNQADGSFDDVRWGTPASGSGKSGLGFDPANPPSVNEPVNTPFLLGTLDHYNNPISSGTAVTSVDLNLRTTISGAVPAVQTFSYRFLVDETPNVLPCAYPSTTPCADRITFTNLDTSSAFTVNGTSYTIALSGFSTNGGVTFTPDFISQENMTNSAGLYAVIRAPTPVPEPPTLLLLGCGLIGLGTVIELNTVFRRRSLG